METPHPRHSSLVTGVILAAGAGTRLGELGRQQSKAMVPVAGRPLIEWVLRMLRAAGVGRMVTVRHPSDTALAAFLKNTYPEITVVMQPERRGIADALRYALPVIVDEPAYVACACDSLFAPEDVARLIALGRQCVGATVIAVLDMGPEATTSRSAVRLDGDRVIEVIEKPAPGTVESGLVALPLYWLPRAFETFIHTVPPLGTERYISTALNAFIRAGGVAQAIRISWRLEITTPQDVAQAERWLREQPA